jgi:hypothetical protein
VAGSTADDPYTRLSIGTTTTYALGIDNSDSDKFKIAYHAGAASPSQTALLISTIAGEVSEPFQPCFLARQNGAADVTGDGTVYNVVFGDEEIFDVGSNLLNGVFTAPVTGKYFLSYNVGLSDIDQDGLLYQNYIYTSNREYYSAWCRMREAASGTLLYYTNSAILADMDAADTAIIKIMASGGNKTYDIVVNTENTYFSGDLVL